MDASLAHPIPIWKDYPTLSLSVVNRGLHLRTCAGVLVSWSIARSSEEIDGVRDHMTILLIAVPFEVSCDSGMPANMYLITPLFRRSLRSFQGC